MGWNTQVLGIWRIRVIQVALARFTLTQIDLIIEMDIQRIIKSPQVHI